MLGDETRAATMLNRHFVDAVRVENKHIGMAGHRIRAKHAGVIELHLQPQGFQGYLDKRAASPHLMRRCER